MEAVTSISGVDAFLKELLKESGVTDYTVESKPATHPGENFTSNLRRLTIDGKNELHEHISLNLIRKTAPSNEKIRLVFPLRSLYKRETYFYTTVFPELEKLRQEYKVKDSFAVVPKMYKASLKEMHEALLLEDMAAFGFKQRSPLESLDREHALLVARSYGKLHALSFAFRHLKPAVFRKLEENTEDHIFRVLQLTEERKAGFKARMNLVLSCLDKKEDRIAYKALEEYSERILETIQAAVEGAGNYSVFAHCDCWINNYLFNYQASSPSSVCILDWQLARCGSPALDLSYFVFACTDQSFRRTHYNAFIGEYYGSFSQFLARFGLNAEEVFPFGVLEEHLKRFSVYGLHMSMLTLSLTLPQGGDVPSFQSSKRESDIFKLREASSEEDRDLYRERMRGIVVDFVNMGFKI